MNKEKFLKSLKSKNSKYKRYLGAPIRYAGGKSLAVGYIVELLPENIKKVVSPFIGGGSVEIALANELNIKVIGYDIFDILVNFWQTLLDKEKKEKLIQKLLQFEPTKEFYYKARDILKEHWKGKIKLNSIDLAAYYYFNHNLSYGPGFLGWASSVYLNKKRYLKMIQKLQNFKAPNLEVYCSSFEETLIKHKNDFLYLDPPYYIGKDSKMFKGIYPQRNFPIHHNNFNHFYLAEILKEHKGGFILSYNDSPTIRELYKDCEIFTPSWQYTMGQGETRIGLNRIKNNSNHIKKSHELLIFKQPNEGIKWQKEQCQVRKQAVSKERDTKKKKILFA